MVNEMVGKRRGRGRYKDEGKRTLLAFEGRVSRATRKDVTAQDHMA